MGRYREVNTRDIMTAADAQWFADHPGARLRSRDYICGEMETDSGGICGGGCEDCRVHEEFFVIAYRGSGRELTRKRPSDELVAELSAVADVLVPLYAGRYELQGE